MRILLVLASVASFLSFPETGSGETLDFVFVSTVPGASFAFRDMAREAQEILARAGIQARFRRAAEASAAVKGSILLILLERPQGSLPAMTLGAVTTTTQSGAWLYLEPLAKTLGLDPRDPRSWPSVEKVRFSRALGRVASHEAVHLLLPTLEHSRSGLMGRSLGRQELVRLKVSLDSRVEEAISERGGVTKIAAVPSENPFLSNPLEVEPF